MAVGAAALRPAVALSRVAEAGVAPPHVEVVTVAPVACLYATSVAQTTLWLTLAVLKATWIPVDTHLMT